MSWRPSTQPLSGAQPGSLFGVAIGAHSEGAWRSLAISPPHSEPGSPPTSTTLVPLPSEFSLDATGDATMTPADEAPLLQSVCPTWAYALDDAVLLLFDQEASSTMTVRSTPRRIHNRDPVTVKAVVADAVHWKPMRGLADCGDTGHVYHLSCGGTSVCRIEVNTNSSGTALDRVAIKQANHSPLAVASGIADQSSLLVYDSPDTHVCSLHKVQHDLVSDTDMGYAPVAECCVTRNLDRLVLRTASGHEHDADARPVWGMTRDFLKSMSSAAADCVDRYAESEISRTGAHELRGVYRQWRSVVA